jgi:hypothetical protein
MDQLVQPHLIELVLAIAEGGDRAGVGPDEPTIKTEGAEQFGRQTEESDDVLVRQLL